MDVGVIDRCFWGMSSHTILARWHLFLPTGHGVTEEVEEEAVGESRWDEEGVGVVEGASYQGP